MQRPPGADARVGPETEPVADDLVDIDDLAVGRDREQRGLVPRGDEPLEHAARDRPQLEPVGDAEPELDERHAEREPLRLGALAAEIPALRRAS